MHVPRRSCIHFLKAVIAGTASDIEQLEPIRSQCAGQQGEGGKSKPQTVFSDITCMYVMLLILIVFHFWDRRGKPKGLTAHVSTGENMADLDF